MTKEAGSSAQDAASMPGGASPSCAKTGRQGVGQAISPHVSLSHSTLTLKFPHAFGHCITVHVQMKASAAAKRGAAVS